MAWLAHKYRAAHIDGKHLIPQGRCHFGQWYTRKDGGVVDENVYAPELRDSGFDQTHAVRLHSHIGRHKTGFSAGRLDRTLHTLAFFMPSPRHDHRHAAGRQLAGNLLPNTSG